RIGLGLRTDPVGLQRVAVLGREPADALDGQAVEVDEEPGSLRCGDVRRGHGRSGPSVRARTVSSPRTMLDREATSRRARRRLPETKCSRRWTPMRRRARPTRQRFDTQAKRTLATLSAMDETRALCDALSPLAGHRIGITAD